MARRFYLFVQYIKNSTDYNQILEYAIIVQNNNSNANQLIDYLFLDKKEIRISGEGEVNLKPESFEG
jgi:hypothetical protein